MRILLPMVLIACGDPATEGALEPVEQLVRVSMALRGMRPEPEAVRAVEADPQAVSRYAWTWAYGPDFGPTLRDLHAESLWLRADTQPELPAAGPLAGVPRGRIQASIGEAPLRLIEDVVRSGAPYTAILGVPWTLADSVVAGAYGLPYDPAGPEWQRTEWTDGRPAAGILAMNGLWQRHISSDTNHNRARANLVARALLCADFEEARVPLEDADLADPRDSEQTIAGDAACQSCHVDLDPLGSYFWGFKRYILPSEIREAHAAGCPDPDLCFPLQLFDAAQADGWSEHGLPGPGFYGQPGTDLAELGATVAMDPRFRRCTVRRFEGWLTQTEPAALDADLVERRTQQLVRSGYDVRELAVHIVLDPDFLAADAPLQAARPEQYARLVEQLTGYRWMIDPVLCAGGCWGAMELATTDNFGFRSLLGGIDGYDVLHPTHTSTPTRVLGIRRLARNAAAWAVAHDRAARPEDRKLLVSVDPDDDDPTAVRAGLEELHVSILGTTGTEEQLDELEGLWTAARGRHGTPADAWKLTVEALLRDPRVVFY